jgi:hypothetical protein
VNSSGLPKPKVLVVISYPGNVIGGHRLSGFTLAKALGRDGYDTGLLIVKPPFNYPELADIPVRIHYSVYPPGFLAYISRALDIFRVVRKYHYQALVAMDAPAAAQAALAAVGFGLEMVQVVAGGEVRLVPPVCFPGIMVFSKELLLGIPERHGIPANYLRLSAGRVDFPYFEGDKKEDPRSLGFATGRVKLLCVSRLDAPKVPAMLALFDQVQQASEKIPLQLAIVGSGDGEATLQFHADQAMRDTGGRADIRLMGPFRVRPSDLRQADLVIGQGRTVIEALAGNVPAAVCGNSGYFGLIRREKFSELAATNLTGRGMAIQGNLKEDLVELQHYSATALPEVRSLAYDLYDSHLGAKTLADCLEDIERQYPSTQTRRAALWETYLHFFLFRARLWLSGTGKG